MKKIGKEDGDLCSGIIFEGSGDIIVRFKFKRSINLCCDFLFLNFVIVGFVDCKVLYGDWLFMEMIFFLGVIFGYVGLEGYFFLVYENEKLLLLVYFVLFCDREINLDIYNSCVVYDIF